MEALVRAAKATSTVRWRYSCCYMQPFVQASCTPWFLAGYIHFLGGRAWTTESETGNTGRIWSPANSWAPRKMTIHRAFQTWSVLIFSFHIQMLLAEWCRQWFQMWKSRRHSTPANLFTNLPWKYRLSVCFTLPHTFQTLRFHSIAPSCVQSFFRASGGHGPETAPAFQAPLPPERAGFRLNKCLWSCCRYKSTCRYFTPIAMNSWCDLDITGLHERQVL